MNRKTVANQLPCFVAPMLARPGRPFDSADYLFEIKWDGTRMLAAIDRGGYRLVNRHGRERTAQYPESECLREFPAGTLLDGEMIVLQDSKPVFGKLLTREQTQDPLKIRMLARSLPAVYVAFDLLYADYEPLFQQPLERRRERLQKLVEDHEGSEIVFSAGVVGQGRAFFEKVCREGLEGVVAKRRGSRYRPGKRTDAWIKIKPRHGAESIAGD
jgi:ATP-dependent DNA ligase